MPLQVEIAASDCVESGGAGQVDPGILDPRVESFPAAFQPESATRSRWVLPEPLHAEAIAMASQLGVPVWFAGILWSRGIRNEDAARAFLSPTYAQMHDPLHMCGMAAAVARIALAVQQREPMLIYGDYDVDGTLATVLLKTAIDRVTPKGEPSLVRYHIPHRIREGYGVQPAVLGDAVATGIRLAISVDTGIRAFAAADEAKALGLDLIVTDHHLPEECGVPDALAVVNPNQIGCDYPFKELCGAAVAYKLAQALLTHVSRSAIDGLQPVDPHALRAQLLPSLLKLVAIASVADAVPLTGENRAIVALGLKELRQVRQPGLRALMRLAEVGTGDEPPTATEIAFRIGPRINAAGRMDIASDVVRLLLTRDAEEAETLAQKLHALNEDRRAVEKTVLTAIEAELSECMADPAALQRMGCVVLDGVGWHRGVIGILASRVVERTGRPALVITHEDGQAHGSGRSIAGFHLLDAVTAAHLQHEAETGNGLFHRFGGHAHAVGFALPSARVPDLKARLTRYAQGRLTPQLVSRTLQVDAELPLPSISGRTLQELRWLEPFGHGNAEPVFVARGVRVTEMRTLQNRHLKLRFERDGSTALSCLCWSRSIVWPDRLMELGVAVGSRVDIIFQLTENRHPEFGGPELRLCDLRVAA